MALQAFVFKKECTGSLVVTLESYNFSTPARNFEFAHNVNKLVVPYNYALGLFVTQGARAQLELGYFTVEKLDELKKAAGEQGILDEVLTNDTKTFSTIERALTNNDTKKIRELLASKDALTISTLVSVAADKAAQLTSTNIDLIEKGCGVSLIVED